MADDPRFWILDGDAPTGPFALPELHARLAAGSLTWQTRACRVGDAAWKPLMTVPGIGPHAPDPRSAESAENPESTARPVELPSGGPAPEKGDVPTRARVVTATPALAESETVTEFVPALAPTPPAPPASSANFGETLGGLIVMVGLAGLLIYFVWGLLVPMGPREVAERFGNADTAAEAKRYAVPVFHPAIDVLYRLPGDNDPDDRFAFTGDAPVPGAKDEYFVGFRGSTFVPEAGRRMTMEGVVFLTKPDGWKVRDLLLVSIDGARLERPISFAADLPGQAAAPSIPRLGPDLVEAARVWYESPRNKSLVGFFSLAVLAKSGVLKGIAVGLGALLAGAGAVAHALRKRPRA